ncbi:MAG: hypothetical protein KDD44_11425, partial [Bdellovibrionales bacterium]|nr:hypothetical protein [Bdellovibrionales bacterium]
QTVNFSGSTKLDPILHLEMQNARLEEIANSLADSVHYRSYVASGIADRLVSIKLLGTVDELALEIERRQQIKVVVDHENREIRFLADKVLPSFYQKEVIENEHKSNY